MTEPPTQTSRGKHITTLCIHALPLVVPMSEFEASPHFHLLGPWFLVKELNLTRILPILNDIAAAI